MFSEAKDIEKIKLGRMCDMIDQIKYSVKAMAHTDQYSMHKYYARRPYNVFRNLIDHYTEEGDTVLDVFCGGGVTIFESLFLNRKVIGVFITGYFYALFWVLIGGKSHENN